MSLLAYPKFKALDSLGIPISGGKLYTYEPGSSTPKASYSNYALTVANDNPVVLDSNGEATVFLNGEYKLILKTSLDVTIWTLDNIRGMGDYWESGFSYADYSEADQGVTGGGDTIKAYVDALGSDQGTIHLKHSSGGATTTYTLGTSLTIPVNVKLRIDKGAIISVSADQILTLNGPLEAGLYQIFSGAGTVAIGSALGELPSVWWPSINAAVTSISAVQTALVVTSAQTLTASLTIPSTLALRIIKGGSIVKASTYTLTINGPFEAGLYQVFSGFSAGDVTFGAGYVKEIYPQWFGAKGDDTTDDGASFTQAAYAMNSALIPFFIPPGHYLINTTVSFPTGFFSVVGASVDSVYLRTTNNIPIFQLNASAQAYYNSITNITFIGDVTGTRTSNSGIYIFTSGAEEVTWAYNQFHHLRFLGTYHAIHVNKNTVPVNKEMMFDWNQFTNNQCSGYGANSTERFFFSNYGSGTGNIFTNNNLVVNLAGLYWTGADGSNIGDILIANNHFGGNGTALYFGSPASYKSNIAISGCQFDAGIDVGFDFAGTAYTYLHINNISWGGGVSYNFGAAPISSLIELPAGLYGYNATGVQTAIFEY